MRALTVSFALLFFSARAFSAPLDLAPLQKWLSRQGDIHAVSADFVQTRSLRALRSPLASAGRLWFSAPDSFRWELGQPAKTIVLRRGDELFVIQPGKKKAERSAVNGASSPSSLQAFGMMTFPFARDLADFQKRFEPLAIRTEGTRCHLEVLPREAQARKVLAALKLDFDTESGHLLAFELQTREGSSLRNEFANVRVNPKLDRAVFAYDFAGFEVVDARK